MDKLTVKLNGIEFNIIVDSQGEYPSITITDEKNNPISFVEVNTFDRNIATIAYNEENDDYENKTIFKRI